MLKKLAMTMASTALMFSMGAGVAFADGVTSSPDANAADVNGNATSAAQTTTTTASGASSSVTGKSPKTGMEDTYAIAAATAAAAVAAAGAGVALRKETARK